MQEQSGNSEATTPVHVVSAEVDSDELEIPHPFLLVTDAKKRAYLIAQASCPSTRIAREIAQVSQKTVWNWRHRAETNPDLPESKAYLDALRLAHTMAITEAENEAWERATTGWKEPVFGQISEPVEIDKASGDGTRIVWRNRTGVVGEITKKSDTMLIFMLKGHKPETYRDNVHVSGSMGIVLRVTLPDNGRARMLPSESAQ